MRQRPNLPLILVWVGVAIAIAAAITLSVFAIRSVTGGGGSSSTQTPTPVASQTPRPTSTIATPATTATRTPTLAPTSPPPPPAPTPTPTPDFTKQPSIQVVSLSPALGTHVETDSVDIKIDVSYQAGRDSNVVGWHILYCASPIDCNTYGGPGTDIVPGSSGSLTIGAPFPAGGNHLRPIVICQYTVEIAHFLTPEAQYQSQLADDPRCHPPANQPAIKVTGVTPPLGTILKQGDVVSVNVEYDAGPATRIEVRYLVAGCTGDIFAVGLQDVQPGASGVTTILVPVTAAATGELHHIDAQLLNAALPVATYTFGPC